MLANFYTSKDWVNLMQVIRLERVNSEGLLICEHCGKPIIAKYDCIGHHIIELNNQNYLDANIALNPENIMLVHHRCHNKIHDRLGLSYTKQIYLVYGSPLSGKSTFVKDSMSEGDLIIDVDSIWECVSGCSRYTKPNRLKQNVFAVRDALLDMVKVRRGNWLNAYIIGGYPLISERERLIKSMSARPIFIDTSKEECIRRLQECNDGRNIDEWEKFIFDWWEKYSPQYH
jgi:hypothetical protein